PFTLLSVVKKVKSLPREVVPMPRSPRALPLIACVSGLLLARGPAGAQGQPHPSPAAVAFFESKIRPLFAEACSKCHGAKKQRAGLRLDSRAAILQGGDSGPALVPGHPEKSLLLK